MSLHCHYMGPHFGRPDSGDVRPESAYCIDGAIPPFRPCHFCILEFGKWCESLHRRYRNSYHIFWLFLRFVTTTMYNVKHTIRFTC